MALIECDECGRRISDKSLFCPGCGYPTHLNKALQEPPVQQKLKEEPLTEPEPDNTYKEHIEEQVKEASPQVVTAPIDEEQTQVEVQPEELQLSDSPSPEADLSSHDKDEPVNADGVEVDPLAEYEASLSKPRTPQSNKNMKVWLLIGVFTVLLLLVGACYYYAKSNHLGSIDDVVCEPVDETELLNEVAPADSVTIEEDENADSTAYPPIETSPAVKQL